LIQKLSSIETLPTSRRHSVIVENDLDIENNELLDSSEYLNHRQRRLSTLMKSLRKNSNSKSRSQRASPEDDRSDVKSMQGH